MINFCIYPFKLSQLIFQIDQQFLKYLLIITAYLILLFSIVKFVNFYSVKWVERKNKIRIQYWTQYIFIYYGSGKKGTLVPYRIEHVPKYHEWMQDQNLLELTASEPLTLDQEFEMQQSWANDPNKCTFILFDNDTLFEQNSNQIEQNQLQLQKSIGMAGDVNLFLNDLQDRQCAEIDVMVAEEKSRRKGIAREAVRIMMTFGAQKLGIKKFVAKIAFSNLASQQLFKSLGFVEVGRSEVFQEIIVQFMVAENVDDVILQELCYGKYD
eukprot:TRINITY_DN7132_c0_g1_i7.p1 TRINITY_DN7132_c0_g1~~TRINITY_DN7132_c0_g1_i7.p1  ORF type:complete len:268 (+),score=22.99 TRINITY_DN7132_c0_g1_i7:131-934(+)